MYEYNKLLTIERILSSKTDKQLGIAASSIQSTNNQSIKRVSSYLVAQAPDTFDYEFNLFNIPKSRQPKSDRVAFSRVLTMLDWINKSMKLQHYDSIVQISTSSKSLIELLGSSMAIKRTINLAIKIGLLAPYTEAYHFGSPCKHNNYARTYILNKFTYKIYREYCRDNKITIIQEYKRRYKYCDTLFNKLVSFNADACRVGCNLNIRKLDDMTKPEFEHLVIETMKSNYNKRWHGVYDWIESRINTARQSLFYRQNPLFAPIFRPNVTWSKKTIRKIGLRATNSYIAAKKCREVDDPADMIYRDDVRKQFNLNWEYDVVSSIPRCIFLMNHGIWLDDDIDCYELIYRELQKLDSSFMDKPYNADVRKAIKRLFMTVCFDRDTMMATHVANRIALHKSHADYDAYDWRTELPKLMKLLKQATVNAIGNFSDSEIFLIESAIYADVAAKLLQQADVWQVYDCFYTSKQIDVANIVKSSAQAFYAQFISSTSNVNEDNQHNHEDNKSNNKYYNNTILYKYHNILNQYKKYMIYSNDTLFNKLVKSDQKRLE